MLGMKPWTRGMRSGSVGTGASAEVMPICGALSKRLMISDEKL
jgi:hypothetical protein